MRRKTPKQVTQYAHPSGVVIPILFDANQDKLEFVARITDSGDELREKDCDKLTALLTEYLDAATQLTWTPVIEIHYGNRSLDAFKFERFYLARNASGDWRKLYWEGYLEKLTGKGYEAANVEMERLRISNRDYYEAAFDVTKLPYFTGGHREQTIVAYTAEKYAALEAVDFALAALRDRLAELLGSDKGMVALQSAGKNAAQLMLK